MRIFSILVLIFLIIAMAIPPSNAAKAIAILQSSKGTEGTIQFQQDGDGPTTVTGSLSGLTPGLHGFHVYEFGDVTDDCKNVGGHFNPSGKDHGAPYDENRHAGDLGNINVGDDGMVGFSIIDNQIPLAGPNFILGRSIVVHANPDDLGKGGTELSLITGNSGANIACGVIGIQG